MSIEYDYSCGIGFLITKKMVPESFIVHRPKRTKEEPRFDPKTGKPIAPVTVVVEEEHDEYKFEKKRCDEFGEFLWLVARSVDGQLQEFGSDVTGDISFMIAAKGKPSKNVKAYDEDEFIRWYCPVSQIIERYPQLKMMQQKLESLGFKVGEPKVVLMETLS